MGLYCGEVKEINFAILFFYSKFQFWGYAVELIEYRVYIGGVVCVYYEDIVDVSVISFDALLA